MHTRSWLCAVAVVLTAVGCAHAPAAPVVDPTPAPERHPEPVRLVVRATDPGMTSMVPAARAQAQQGLTALGHALSDSAPVLVELELGPQSTSAEGTCIALRGRVTHGDQQFAAPEFTAQQCADPRKGTNSDLNFFALTGVGDPKALPQQTPVSAGLSAMLMRLSLAARR